MALNYVERPEPRESEVLWSAEVQTAHARRPTNVNDSSALLQPGGCRWVAYSSSISRGTEAYRLRTPRRRGWCLGPLQIVTSNSRR